jgi:transposase-like protein
MTVTLGEALIAAHDAMLAAEQEFRSMLREASDRGASTREMAKLLGWNHSTLWRWLDRPPHDNEASVLEEDR